VHILAANNRAEWILKNSRRGREGERVEVDKEVLIMFVTADGADTTKSIFRSAQNGIKYDGGKKKTKECIKISGNHTSIFKMI
jgi:hypothetical protein